VPANGKNWQSEVDVSITTAFWGSGQRSEWRFKLSPEELLALEERERPRLEKARAAREARRPANREAWAQERYLAGLDQIIQAAEKRQQKEHRQANNHKLCGAGTRKDGSPCRSVAIRPNGRCKWHAGLSTGPTTPQGLERMRQAKAAVLG
jgi:hypothetical protein